MGWISFIESGTKATPNFKVRIEFMEDSKWAKKMWRWARRGSARDNRCKRVPREYAENIGLGISIEGLA